MDARPFVLKQDALLKLGCLILLFSIFDTICTDIGIRQGHIEEANPAMHFVYTSSIYAFYFLKISLPILLLFLIQKIKPKLYLQFLIGSTLFLYFVIVCKHAFWMFIVMRLI